MLKLVKSIALLMMAIISTSFAQAQEDWPKVINADNGMTIKIYHPEPESFSGDVLKLRSAVSITEAGKTDPVFGTFWSVNTVETDRDNRKISIVGVRVPNLKFGSELDNTKISYIKTALETQIPQLRIDLPMDEVLSMLQSNTEEKKLSKNLNTAPPKIIYTAKPSTLVLIDGAPKLQHNNDWGMDVVVNSPFTIVKNTNGLYYLYGGKHWYSAPAATGPYSYVNNTPSNLTKVQTSIDNAAANDPGFTSDSAAAKMNMVTDIIVSTEPAELIQTNGEPDWSTIQGTNLMYAGNSENDLFIDQSSRMYYVLLSGRWYQGNTLKGPWSYVASDQLPSDFSKIPEGSPKDNVLASVAGTQAAREAVMDAEIPQTAKVDRSKANTSVTYDGSPRFEDIDGTHMQYAVNARNSVIRYRDKYYTVDNGVWFESYNPNGPWVVCTERPAEVDIIPPSYPVYNMKYVYIYDVTPDWVYMGYTPGYLNTFIYGPTVVYGTGFYYRPWWGRYYYPRPYTWGFRMHYNPWYGWSIGYNYSSGWFNMGFGVNVWSGWCGGWWGPALYRPPYHWYGGFNAPYRSYGYYGRRPFNNTTVVNNIRVNNYSNNIYNLRRDVVTRNNVVINNRNNTVINNGRIENIRRPSVMPNNPPVRQNNGQFRNLSIMTDRQGNVYQRTPDGQLQQNRQGGWRPVDNRRNNDVFQNFNREQQMHNRGQMRTQNFQMMRQAPSVPAFRPSQAPGGGNRGGGGNFNIRRDRRG